MESLIQISASPTPLSSLRLNNNGHHPPTHISFASKSFASPLLSVSASSEKPVVVVGSANADIYVEIDRLPKEGETVSARSGETLAGGKGANQACCGARLCPHGRSTFFLGRVGSDAHGQLIEDALSDGGVRLDRLQRVEAAPTGHAVVMLQENGQNSIIIVGGANIWGWSDEVEVEDLEVVKDAGIVLLQREIPDHVNLQVAQVARRANVPVILDVGGMEGAISKELINVVDILSPNETELARLTGMPTENFEQITHAAMKCHEMGTKQVLVKLGEKGSALFIQGQEPIRQSIITAKRVVDTTGAGDTFTAAFAVALVEGKSKTECLKFAAAAASLCVQVKGAIPSMPKRAAVMKLLDSL
ncbi:Ribokinase/fructokinase protein [Dioscorea alata]|uniref:Ribokinase/fructokinase protein n=1 Tax=Dioscorea alata TaxID=55571 RepID=A0ACB7TVA5_DIOAL|nr:Ribokinase/fructokinase protein [Dioscorea alata]